MNQISESRVTKLKCSHCGEIQGNCFAECVKCGRVLETPTKQYKLNRE
ncbi:hypothetical protein [Candidatus Hodarchaeum mangrovi]